MNRNLRLAFDPLGLPFEPHTHSLALGTLGLLGIYYHLSVVEHCGHLHHLCVRPIFWFFYVIDTSSIKYFLQFICSFTGVESRNVQVFSISSLVIPPRKLSFEGSQYIGLVRAHVCSNFIKMGLAGFRYWIAICSWSNVQLISPKSRFIFNVQYSISYKIYPGDCYIEMAYLLCWIRAQTIVKLQFEEQTEVGPYLNWSQKLIIVIIV